MRLNETPNVSFHVNLSSRTCARGRPLDEHAGVRAYECRHESDCGREDIGPVGQFETDRQRGEFGQRNPDAEQQRPNPGILGLGLAGKKSKCQEEEGS